MSNPNNKKIQTIWYNSQSYKNYIASLEKEQQKIDEERKNKPQNFIKKIYSNDSGEITPVVFVIGKWIERFFITPIKNLIDLNGYYDGQNELILTDEKYFDGDKGEWLAEGEVALQIFAPLKPPEINVDGYSEGKLNINVSANDSESHLLNISAEGKAYCSTSYSTGVITLWARRIVHMDGSGVFFEDFINQKLKTTTYIDMFSGANLSDISKCGISCEITFDSGRSIEYVYGRQIHSETLYRKIITLLDFTNLNLPIYTDYIAKWGSLLPGETIAGVNFYVAFSLSADMGNTISANMSAFATKIAVRNKEE